LSDDSSDPQGVIDTGREAVRKSVGRYPNTLVMGAMVFNVLKEHPRYADKLKYTDRDSVTPDMLAKAMNLEGLRVGAAVYYDEATGENIDIWGNVMVLAYIPPDHGTLADRGVPSYGYTYTLRGYPMTEKPYQDRNAKSWIYPVTNERAPVLCGMEAGYLVEDVVAVA